MDKSAIIKEIMSYYSFKKDYMFAKFLGITSQRLSNWINRGTYNAKILSTKCLDFNADWILNGTGPALKKEYKKYNLNTTTIDEPDNSSSYKKGKNNYLPVYKLTLDTSLKELLSRESQKPTIVTDFIRIPNTENCDGALHIDEDSMLPLLKKGDIVVFEKITTKNIILDRPYLIETISNNKTTPLTIRYLQKSESGRKFIKLTSKNPSFKDLDIPIDEIDIIALIRSSIQTY